MFLFLCYFSGQIFFNGDREFSFFLQATQMENYWKNIEKHNMQAEI